MSFKAIGATYNNQAETEDNQLADESDDDRSGLVQSSTVFIRNYSRGRKRQTRTQQSAMHGVTIRPGFGGSAPFRFSTVAPRSPKEFQLLYVPDYRRLWKTCGTKSSRHFHSRMDRNCTTNCARCARSLSDRHLQGMTMGYTRQFIELYQHIKDYVDEMNTALAV